MTFVTTCDYPGCTGLEEETYPVPVGLVFHRPCFEDYWK